MRILIIIALLLPQLIFAQSRGQYMQGNNLYMIKGNGDTILINAGSNTLPSSTLATVNSIASYNNPTTTTIFVKEPKRGGTFFLYNGSDTADGGMIFTDANNNKWIRQTGGNTISTAWYGMKSLLVGNTQAANDSYGAFMKALNYIYSHKQFNTLYIPYDSTGQKVYFFLSTITLDKDINIIGDATFNSPSTTLLFNGNVKCFFLASTYGAHIKMENLLIQQATPQGGYDSTAHGIESRTFTYLKNIEVNQVSGNGVHIAACAALNSPIFGNADFSIIDNLQTFACNNGLYFEGCDANVITVNNGSFVSSRRWGVYDDGFLGNLYKDCHFANNGKSGFSLVTFNGNYYVSKDSSYNVGKRPDLNPEYWQITEPMGGASAWDTSKRYYSGGVAIIRNINAFSKFDHCYTEDYQPPVILNNRSSYEGGTIGAAVLGGVMLRVLNGIFIANNTNGSQFQKLGVGQAPSNHTISVTGSDYQLMKLTSPSSVTALSMANNVDTNGGLTYSGLDLVFTSGSNYRMKVNKDGLFPYNQDAVLNLGSPALRFDSIHAVKYYGDGSSLTGLPSGSGITQQTLNDTAAAIRSAIPTVTGGSPILITLADNFSSSSTTMANVTGWDFPVTIGKIYRIEVIGDYQSSQATTTGCKFGIALSGGADGTVKGSARGTVTAAAAATELVIPIRAISGTGSFLQTSGVNAVNTPQAVSMVISFTCTASGTFNIQFGSEVNTSETRLNLGSSLIYQILN